MLKKKINPMLCFKSKLNPMLCLKSKLKPMLCLKSKLNPKLKPRTETRTGMELEHEQLVKRTVTGVSQLELEKKNAVSQMSDCYCKREI